MEEKRELIKLHGTFQFTVYLLVGLEIFLFAYAYELLANEVINEHAGTLISKLYKLPIYQNLLFSKLTILTLLCLTAIGTKSKKALDLDPKKTIIFPLTFGLLLFFGSIYLYNTEFHTLFLSYTSRSELAYIFASVIGVILMHISLDNISKFIKSGLGKDEWNMEGESFLQDRELEYNDNSVNIPMKFYYKRKVQQGWINIVNPFRGTLLIGTPGSGKSYGVVNPFIRQMIQKGYTMCLYDFAFPNLGQIAYYHYLLAKQKGKNKNFKFHVINLDDIEHSRRINPMKREYFKTVADASETAEAIVQSLQKSESSGGSDKFFTQSAVNFLSSCIYFISRTHDGKYSTFAHLLAFLNKTYQEIFTCLGDLPELESLLSPFQSALEKKAYDQLEGQIGTLKIFISRLNTPETAWVFSADDFDLKVSNPESPCVLVLANSSATQNINSTCYATVVNRLTRLVNTEGNLPTAIIADEAPTLYIHKIENLISTARKYKVAVLLGLQEIPQLRQLQGKDTATTITAVIGNVLSGSVRNKETLDWLERLFGKRKQLSESVSIDRTRTSVSMNEKNDPLIPAGKIAALNTGEMVGLIAKEAPDYNGKYKSSNIHCKITLDGSSLKQEEEHYQKLPKYYDMKGNQEKIVRDNFMKIRAEVTHIVDSYIVLTS